MVRYAGVAAVLVLFAAAGPAAAADLMLQQSRDFAVSNTITLRNADFFGTPASPPETLKKYDSASPGTAPAISFAGFDSALGTLTGVVLNFSSGLVMKGGISVVAAPGTTAAGFTYADAGYGVSAVLGGKTLEASSGSLFRRYLQYLTCGSGPSADPCFLLAPVEDRLDFEYHATALDLFTSNIVELELDYVQSLRGEIITSGVPLPTLTTANQLDWNGNVTLSYFYQAAPSLVPEPASWAMMLAGFGLAGAAMRKRSGQLRYS